MRDDGRRARRTEWKRWANGRAGAARESEDGVFVRSHGVVSLCAHLNSCFKCLAKHLLIFIFRLCLYNCWLYGVYPIQSEKKFCAMICDQNKHCSVIYPEQRKRNRKMKTETLEAACCCFFLLFEESKIPVETKTKRNNNNNIIKCATGKANAPIAHPHSIHRETERQRRKYREPKAVSHLFG